jgi:2',3'-cyclic-nucleotide 2'-phosphodiesterase (5'-nucleotidase family)
MRLDFSFSAGFVLFAGWLGLGCGERRAPVVGEVRPSCGVQNDGSIRFPILHINDVYRIEGLLDGRGGLARVRTLRKSLEAQCGEPVLLTHGGDALRPSLASGKLGGEQMIDVLNLLDGDAGKEAPVSGADLPKGFDDHLLFVPGNHEFDRSSPDGGKELDRRISESRFIWVSSNIQWKAPGLFEQGWLASRSIVEVHGVKVGFFGLTTPIVDTSYAKAGEDWLGVARTQAAELRGEGAQVVVALTHLDRAQDVSILESLGAQGPDLVLGGHDHVASTDRVDGRVVAKGDADAVTVRVAWLRVGPGTGVRVEEKVETVELGPKEPAADVQVVGVVEDWLRRVDREECPAEAPDCLRKLVGHVQVALEGAEADVRGRETNLGNWVADLVRASVAADLAVVNGGALRLNQTLPAGEVFEAQVRELDGFSNQIGKVEVSGAQLAAALAHSVAGWPGQGHFLQVSGVRFSHDTESGRICNIQTQEGKPILDADKFSLAAPVFLLDPKGNRDGYTMLPTMPAGAPQGATIRELVRSNLVAAEPKGVAPSLEGRIRQGVGICAGQSPR